MAKLTMEALYSLPPDQRELHGTRTFDFSPSRLNEDAELDFRMSDPV